MESPVTPKPMPTSTAELPLDHTIKLFGIVYITLIVKSDKFLLTMHVIESQIRDLNPNTLRDASLQAQLPGCRVCRDLRMAGKAM
ncbi:hypothetical protein DSO57_1027285 [Entomophthora muscae]|uniref:Uncharacterized protein n=1 Tax=Entomophthora muscae TaxID=34485 RepID=A0ACC2UB89_9FUNG|nr:hypothetical protein DSO57_1027285 [Entomophthora muscae]